MHEPDEVLVPAVVGAGARPPHPEPPDGAPDFRLRSMAAALRALTDLMLNQEEYEEGFEPPTRDAFRLAWDTVEGAAYYESVDNPSPGIAPIGDGGLFLQWGGPRRYVRLLVPRDATRAYIYRRAGEDKHVESEVSGESLEHSLRWLRNG
jgi:hypothetical protein